MFQANVLEKIETNILRLVPFFPPENAAVYEIMWKHVVRATQKATDDNMAHADCMLDN
jgi:hypothetical protein